MKRIPVFLLFYITQAAMAQGDSTEAITVDILRAPASPASNLLGIAPSDIDRPTDVSAFMVSLQTATGSFNKLPSNYAVDIAPYWFFKNAKKGDITTKGFRQSGGATVFKQTLVLSFAFRKTDSTETSFVPSSTYTGFGFKFYLMRGHYDRNTENVLDTIQKFQRIKLQRLDSLADVYAARADPARLVLISQQNELYIRAKKGPKITPEEVAEVESSAEYKRIDSLLKQRLLEFKVESRDQAYADLEQQIQQWASGFQATRIGWTWDISGGAGTEFRFNRFNNARLYNAGIWTTIGYTDSVYGAGLLLLRLLHNPDRIFAKDNAAPDVADISTFDAGLRYIYAKPQGRFSASIEAIYRSVLTSRTIDPSWRVLFNADYEIWKNQKLTFSFGRNFDGTISKGGNLIAALTFLTGFGNKR